MRLPEFIAMDRQQRRRMRAWWILFGLQAFAITALLLFIAMHATHE